MTHPRAFSRAASVVALLLTPQSFASGAPSDGKPKNVSPHALDADVRVHTEPHLPEFVKAQRRGLGDVVFAAKVCVNPEGKVFQVNVLRSIAGADDALVGTIKQWSYAAQPVSVCFVANLIFSVE